MRVKRFLLLFFVLSGIAAAQESRGDIEVSLTGFRNETGVVLINLFHDAENYPQPEKAFRQIVLKPGEKVAATFRNIPYGEYSISVIHDENEDKRFTMKWLPWPRPLEGGGFSNNAEASMGPPDYEKTLFAHARSRTTQKILITYP